jgi:hypothetical protein
MLHCLGTNDTSGGSQFWQPHYVTSAPTTFGGMRKNEDTFNATMAPPNNRKEILEKLRKSISDGTVIVGAGAGIGLSAKFIEQGGGDLIIIYNSGRFRMAGRGSLAGLMPYGNANDVVLEMVGPEQPMQIAYD